MSTLSSFQGQKGRADGCLDLSSLSIEKVLNVLKVWTSRARQRRALSKLDDRMLKDIGLSRAEARQEAVKPFWCE